MKVGKGTKKYFALVSSFILLGFFVSILHLSPEIHHQGDNHTEHETLVDGVDHQPSLTSSHSDLIKLTQIAFVYQTNIFSEMILNQDNSYLRYEEINAPPDKIPLYIKNNTFLI